ncbi:secretion protein F [Paludicola sp. MB14-C6]|uniref:secretion protein F n=1 Tax=Paludihabitans sp. MB14-C6 TaxID=3070656 RepID=UPI0027DB0804|nr:secretion protein F [Paludicola sp. MB14-C6]WMJ22877.1 secretion protein F [Paludicola sp. MB14-C6]
MIEIAIGILVGIGLFFIISDLFRIPFLKTSKAYMSLLKRQGESASAIVVWKNDVLRFIAKLIKINEYKRLQLIADLRTAGVNLTPEVHIANALLKAGICGLLTIPAFFVLPLITPLIVALTIAVYFKEAKGIQERIKVRRHRIDFELPRLVYTIEKKISHNRDVLTILDEYINTAGHELKLELKITVADMRSGNYEAALTRLESRVGSTMLSDVVRGLISVIRGDETLTYWSSLSIKFSDIQRQYLKLEAQKVPSKVKRLSMLLLFCFIAIYLVVITMQVMTSLGAMFA